MEGRNMISMYVPDKAKIKEFTKKVEQERRRMEQELKKRRSSHKKSSNRNEDNGMPKMRTRSTVKKTFPRHRQADS